MRVLPACCLALLLGCAAATSGDEEAGPARGGDDGGRGRTPTTDSGGTIDTGAATDAEAAAEVDAGDAALDGSGEAPDAAADAALDGSGDAATLPDVADATPDTADARVDGQVVDDDCEQVTATAEPVFRPVDIVWVIDTSGSMGQEIELIEREMANFVSFIAASDLDYRVVLIASDPPLSPDAPTASLGVCLPEPLSGAPGCPDTDSERYRHIRTVVNSHESLEVIDEEWDTFADFLRPGASTHFVVVSDDESDRSSEWFQSRIDARLPQGYTFHSIVSLTETEDCLLFICETEGCDGPYGSAEARGTQYIVLSRATGGLEASICDADWAPIFDGIATGVVDGAALPCDYEIPEIRGSEIVYDRVEVTLTTPDSGTTTLERVDDAGSCAPGADQWYYDDNEAPTRVHICPGACGERAGDLQIGFDCVKA